MTGVQESLVYRVTPVSKTTKKKNPKVTAVNE
jgi:hypothetical protein